MNGYELLFQIAVNSLEDIAAFVCSSHATEPFTTKAEWRYACPILLFQVVGQANSHYFNDALFVSKV